MGLFGFIGKIAKAGLSVATRGASDVVLKQLKAIGASKKGNARQTTAAQAMAARALPSVKITTHSVRSALEGAAAGNGSPGDTTTKTIIMGRTPRVKAARRRRASVRRKGKRKSTGRKAPASFAAFAAKSKQLAAEWRAAGGKEGTGQTFFEWKRGK